mgnify:CR=1 FL=1
MLKNICFAYEKLQFFSFAAPATSSQNHSKMDPNVTPKSSQIGAGVFAKAVPKINTKSIKTKIHTHNFGAKVKFVSKDTGHEVPSIFDYKKNFYA